MVLPPCPPLTFHRSQRLQANREFQRAKTKGLRLPHGCLIANWLPLPAHEKTRVGVITSKQIGPAVARNRARRLLRESYRLHQHELVGPMDLILIARRSIAGKGFRDVEQDFLAAARRAKLLREPA